MAYTITQQDKYLLIEWHGTLCLEDLGGLRRDLPGWAARLGYAPNVMHNWDKVTQSSLQPLGAYEHSLQRKATRLSNPVKSAAVAKTEEVFKMARLFQELNRNPEIEMRIFTDEQEALAWLRS